MASASFITILMVTLTLHSSHCAADDDGTLVVLNVVYRHGDRAPTEPLPIDTFNETHWEYGYGELTNLGKKQQFELGYYLRQHYNDSGVLGTIFDYKKVYVRSSDVDRCLTSAYSNLAGAYYDGGNVTDFEKDLPHETWRPFPVHSVPRDQDNLLAMAKPCNKVTMGQDQLFNNNTIVQKINNDYAAFFQMLTIKTGLKMTNGLQEMWKISDALKCEKIHNNDTLPVPWASFTNVTCNNNAYIPCANKTVYEILLKMEDLQFMIMFNSTDIHKYDGGPLLLDIGTKYNEFLAKNRTVTFNMYSGHDTTVGALLSALGGFDAKAPPYTAAVFIELWKTPKTADKNATYTVRFKYRNNPFSEDPAKQTVSLNVTECPDPCTLEKFMEMLKPYNISNWDEECGNYPKPTTLNPPNTTSTTTTHPTTKTSTSAPAPGTTAATHKGLSSQESVAVIVCVSIIVMLALVALIIYIKRKRFHGGNAYMQM